MQLKQEKRRGFDRSGKINRRSLCPMIFYIDRNHRWNKLLGSLGIKPHSPSFRYAALWSISDKPPLDNLPWYNGSCLPTLASTCSKSYQLNSYSRNELESGKSGIEGEMETRQERGRVRSRWLDWGAMERAKDGGGRANVCPSELDFSPASVSLLATLWLNYLQSTSNIFKLNFMYAQSCIFPLFLRYETALRSTRALFREESARRVCSVFVLRADVYDWVHRQSLHRNCYLCFPLFFFFFFLASQTD